MNGRLAESVKRIGFRKWYERQLLSSHAHMVLCFLSVIALVASMEAFRVADGDGQIANAMFVLVCTGIGAWAMRRYLFLLMRAEQTANQATCPDCGDYGRFRVVAQRPRDAEFDVECRKCSRGWIISGLQ